MARKKKERKSPEIDNLSIHDPFLDKRVKLLPCQLEMMPYWKNVKKRSLRSIGRIFKVSHNTVKRILEPEKFERELMKDREKGGARRYFDKEKHRQRVAKCRAHKKKIKPLLILPCKETPKGTESGSFLSE